MVSASGWVPPERFEEYRLLRYLGGGALGKVYLATDTLLDRLVAIKFIAEAEPSLQVEERFLREGRAIARVQHPNVLAIHRIGGVDGRPYIVSELLRGRSLDQIAKPVGAGRLLEIALQLARGLAAAHRRGVLHRDVKPSNAVLTDDGEVKLIDFGLAKVVDPHGEVAVPSIDLPRVDPAAVLSATLPLDESNVAETYQRRTGRADLTKHGVLMGTPATMAPEVWRGANATARSDVYSMGVVLYELASGVLPHVAASMQALSAKVVGTDAASLSSVAEVDPSFAAIVDRCLKRDPALRFASGEELREALEELDVSTPKKAARIVPAGNPYRGLAAFEAEHRAFFFGRVAEVRAVVERLRSESLVIVAGDSGVGKSSLCRAGVLPLITEGAVFPKEHWTAITFTPGRKPMSAFASQIALLAGEESIRASREVVIENLRRTQRHHSGLVIFVDQLEELVTISDPAETAELIGTLTTIAYGGLRVRVLATLRSDFLTRVASLPELGQDIARSIFVLRTLSSSGLREAIAGPARELGVWFDPEELVDELVEAVGRLHGMLPLLQFALAELWDARDPELKVITRDALERIGGVEGALARHADAVLSSLRAEQQLIARRLLVRLVTADGTKGRLAASELASDAADTLDALVRARLVVARESSEGVVYELVHDTLITSWATLKEWVEATAGAKVVQERLARAAEDWRRIGDDALWSERQLRDVRGLELSAEQRAFVDASLRSLRRRAWLLRGLVFAVIASISLAVIGGAYQQRRAADQRIDQRIVAAGAALSSARSLVERVSAADRAAFEAFDSAHAAEGETLWPAAREDAREADEMFRRASLELEAALSVDSNRADARALFVSVELERAALAEREGRHDQVKELLGRVSQWDPAALAAWNVPAVLKIESDPLGAVVRSGDRVLGVTPLTVSLAAGSYVLFLVAPDRPEVRHPVLLRRGENYAVFVPILKRADIPVGFVYVPAGRFLFGSDDFKLRRFFYNTAPLHEVWTDAYLISAYETTNAEWIAFLESLPDAERRLWTAPERSQLSQDSSGRWSITLQDATEGGKPRVFRDDEPVVYRRASASTQRWQNLPVGLVSGEEARIYAAWLSRTGRVPGARLCTDHEWERAARGADARLYPSGDTLGAADANFGETYGLQNINPWWGANEVGSFPASASVFGVFDMAGNVLEWVESSLARGEVAGRGGSWSSSTTNASATIRELIPAAGRDVRVGVRICASIAAPPGRLGAVR